MDAEHGERERCGPDAAGAAFPAGGALAQARDAVLARLGPGPYAGAVVLGSGLGALLEHWAVEGDVDVATIPGAPAPGIAGHRGRLARVSWGAARGLVFEGRVHFYEGRRREEVTYAVRLAAALDARWVLLTNASGSVDRQVPPGTIVVVEDHVRVFIGHRSAWGAVAGPRGTGSPYDGARCEALFGALAGEGLRVRRGVLFGGLGPSYETAAEVEMIRRLGATVACMSTVIEAEEAARAGLEVAALSMVTNLATGLAAERLAHEDVVAAARALAPAFARAVDRAVRGWSAGAGLSAPAGG